MIQSHEIRRHPDGSIDFDFYRTRATTMRAQAMQDGLKLKVAFRFTLVTLAMIVGVTIAASAHAHWI
jgi:hypothetical protein